MSDKASSRRGRYATPTTARLGAIAMADAVAREKSDAREAFRLLAREVETDHERDVLGKLFGAVQRRLSRDRQRMVDRLFLARSITRRELFVAEALHALWIRTGLEPRVTACAESSDDGSRFVVSGGHGAPIYGIEKLTERRLEAVDLWKRILALCTESEQQELRRIVLDEPAGNLIVLKAALAKASAWV